MAGGWRATARMLAAATAAAAVSRAAESVRRLLADVQRSDPDGPVSRPEPLHFLEPPTRLTATAGLDATSSASHVIAAQSEPPHEFGPTPVVVPSRGIGFRSEPDRRPKPPAAEMPVISRPASSEPDEPNPTPAVVPESVRTASAIVNDLGDDLDDDPDVEDDELEDEARDDLDDVDDEDADIEPVAETVPVDDEPISFEPRRGPILSDPEPAAEVPVEDVEPPRALRLTAPPIEDTPIEPPPAEDFGPMAEPIVPSPPPAEPEPELHQEAPTAPTEPEDIPAIPVAADTKPTTDPVQTTSQEKLDKGKHRRRHSAISGTVSSTRGRGLRGMQISVLDETGDAVASAVSGANGVFIVEDLPAGSYRVAARDEVDEDFDTAWHQGSSLADAAAIKVKEGKTRRKADVALTSAAAIDVDVDIRKKKVIVVIRVTDRATGTPASGSIRLSTKLFDTELPLSKGTASITLHGSADGLKRSMLKKLHIAYLGSKHTSAGTRTVKLR